MVKEITPTFEMYKALGDATRFRIFLTLAQCRDTMCVNAISAKLKLSQPAVSQHLKILKSAGIALSSREGHKIHYSIDREFVSAFMQKIIGIVQKPDAALKEITEP